MAVTITVEPDNANVCNIYLSAYKDGQLRWIMVNCVQAKSYKSELSQIRDYIRILAEFEDVTAKGDTSGMDTTDDSRSYSSEDVD